MKPHYAKHIVSAKVALYSHDLTKVLVMRYPRRGVNGLPGGHVEKDEQPDAALRRELMEELDLEVGTIKPTDFFLREGQTGPIILAYTAIAPANSELRPTYPQFEYGEWVEKAAIEAIPAMSAEYKRFVLENWPK